MSVSTNIMSDSVNNNHSSKMSSFKITKDDRFFSRLMAKEITTPNSSSRIFYYGETSVTVPFTWEAQPGTPKHPLSETSLPPLTPPPSYFSSSKSHIAKKRNSKANNIFSTILPKFVESRIKSPNNNNNNNNVLQSSSSWSPTSSSSSSSNSSSSLPYYSSSPSFSRSRSPSKHKCSNGFRGCYPFGKTEVMTSKN